ncbi:UDP-N-acetylglucosamine 2-epimerase [Roseibium sp. TrichSKD4]|uniref:non-hydrolyzing UDP-N-acetylglucosamine 2-epimerase n=1 Tax=Roseibium sp. TrichSKD4 TaxID=744980 RepID=UPI0001E56590|nr:UDP-N-acetylglucosamine 2-epimerase (non-hydrolyzing) [Roseibium sp. TrichSKD4]EFO33997.1 UDP-N-acetylglucosamine 2-epimerase [Roseibium sp. TrichSKD4]
MKSTELPLIHLIAAARPNFMKIAPLYHVLSKADWCRVELVHTGQHYDANMSDAFFRDLDLPTPDYHLGVGGHSNIEQTAQVMLAYDRVCEETKPSWIVVVGDVNSTLACALVGVQRGIRTAHLEAGLRSGDRHMPEEINRLLTDAICDLLWTPSPDADENLRLENTDPARVERVGNIMIDTYEMMRDRIQKTLTYCRFGLNEGKYAVVTLHRPSNVDDKSRLTTIVDALETMTSFLPIVFPLHPRTKKMLERFMLFERISGITDFHFIEPLGYVEFMGLASRARLILTDSGGIQEEATYIGIPCLTLRENTERPITLTEGTNRLVDIFTLTEAVDDVLSTEPARKTPPALWDGNTAERVANSLRRNCAP